MGAEGVEQNGDKDPAGWAVASLAMGHYDM